MWLLDYNLLYNVLHNISWAIVVGFCQQIPNIPLEVRNMLLKYLSAFERVLQSWGKAYLLGF